MFKSQYVDPLYRYIEIDPESLNFISHPSIADQFVRLKDISQLGFTSEVFPSTQHSKFTHALGTYFLAHSLIEKTSLPSKISKKKKSFEIAALVHGIGHLPFAFATEKSLLKASLLSDKVNSFLDSCQEEIRKRLSKELSQEEKESLETFTQKERPRIQDFYRFFTVKKLIDEEEDLRDASNGYSGFHFSDLLKFLIVPDFIGFRLLNRVNRLDYVLRDTYHHHLIHTDINLPYFLSKIEFEDGTINLPPRMECNRRIGSLC